MDNLIKDREIVRKLQRTWQFFFEVHGRLLDIQRKSIPLILDGKNILLSSPTATGKTEAVCAPLVEKNIDINSPWTILYISPTRALVNDLYERLYTPLSRLKLRLIRRTSDHPTKLNKIPHILITTPESFDSIMCRGKLKDNRYGHILACVNALVLDEIHLLYGSSRGEQVRWLIERLRRLKNQAYNSGWSIGNKIQIVGLSATIAEPEKVVKYFMQEGELVSSEGKREIIVVNDSIEPVRTALFKYIKNLTNSEKILIFCNARKRVDSLTSEVRRELNKFGYKVVAHHGSLSQRISEDAEEAIKNNDKIVVFATSTLELGIDIGDIDLIILDGPAPDVPAFLQRVGRGNRRTRQMRIMTCADSLCDALIQEAMTEAVKNDYMSSPDTGPNYSVLFQQIASYIFQSPKRSRKRTTIENFLKFDVIQEVVKSIIDSMIESGDLVQDESGLRLGSYWLDMTGYGKIHSNIDSSPGYNVIDEYSGEKIATDVSYVQGGGGLKTGGEFLQIKNFKNYNIEVKKVKDEMLASGEWSYTSKKIFKNSSQANAIRKYLDINDNIWPLIRTANLIYIFHLGGTVRQTIIEALGRMSKVKNIVLSNQFCFAITQASSEKPEWLDNIKSARFEMYLNNEIDWFERKLCRPYLNSKLPCDVRYEEVKKWLNLDSEILSIKEALWEDNLDKRIINACLILSDTKRNMSIYFEDMKNGTAVSK